MAEWTDSGGDTDNVPDGTIVMWNGDPSNVPDSWTLCDGTNPDGPDSDVPDLRNRFIVGAGDEYGEGDTGGEKKVQLTEAELPSHSHSRGHSGGGWGGSGVDGRGSNTVETGSTGDDQPHENRPPYYALAYIMKIGGGGDNQPYSGVRGSKEAVFTFLSNQQNFGGSNMISSSHDYNQSTRSMANQFVEATGVTAL